MGGNAHSYRPLLLLSLSFRLGGRRETPTTTSVVGHPQGKKKEERRGHPRQKPVRVFLSWGGRGGSRLRGEGGKFSSSSPRRPFLGERTPFVPPLQVTPRVVVPMVERGNASEAPYGVPCSGAAISPMRKNTEVLLPSFFVGQVRFRSPPFSLDLQHSSHLSRAGRGRSRRTVHYALNFMSISLPWQRGRSLLLSGEEVPR